MPQKIMLTPEEVPLGARVHLYLPGKDVPEKVNGEDLVLRTLLDSENPPQVRFYQMNGEEPVKELESFLEGVKFSSVEVYSPWTAPVGGEYAVFVDGTKMMNKNTPGELYPLEVRKEKDGKLIVMNNDSREYKEIFLPLKARLVRVDR